MVLVVDDHANVLAKATRPSAESSISQIPPPDVVKTVFRANIAKGAFNVNSTTTGITSQIHVRYDAMDIIMCPLNETHTVVAIGMVDQALIPGIYTSIAKEFPSKKHKALIVDDEEDIRKSIQTVLEHRGFDVDIAGSGAECIKMFEDARQNGSQYGLVLLDIRMPKMDGFEVFKKINAISKETKVIFITAFEYTKEELSKKLSSDRVSVLKKPFNKAKLLQFITAETNSILAKHDICVS
jgi:CheY-like chemotaxis protein